MKPHATHPTAAAIRLLRESHRRWWYHADLRRAGRHDEARRLENNGTRRKIRDLRDMRIAGCARVGWYYSTNGTPRAPHDGGPVYYDNQASVSGCHEDIGQIIDTWNLPIPYVDKSALPDDVLIPAVYASPMKTSTGNLDFEDEQSNHGCSYVSTGSYIAIWEALGARVKWGRLEPHADEFRARAVVRAHVERIRASIARYQDAGKEYAR